MVHIRVDASMYLQRQFWFKSHPSEARHVLLLCALGACERCLLGWSRKSDCQALQRHTGNAHREGHHRISINGPTSISSFVAASDRTLEGMSHTTNSSKHAVTCHVPRPATTHVTFLRKSAHAAEDYEDCAGACPCRAGNGFRVSARQCDCGFLGRQLPLSHGCWCLQEAFQQW